MSRVWVLQHTAAETLGIIADALARTGVSPGYVRTFDGHPVPPTMADAVGLIVMGGPMGVYEHGDYPFLSDEMRLIEQALQQHRPVLGVCLGSQLLAAALGAPVVQAARKEIGWHEITLTGAADGDPLWTGIASPFVGYHWHGDIFDLPSGAVSLARSDLTACQAFRYGDRAYGLLFHLEVTASIIADMVHAFPDELAAAGIVADEILAGGRQHLRRLQEIGNRIFSRWVDQLPRGR